jgi:hypothetical protein
VSALEYTVAEEDLAELSLLLGTLSGSVERTARNLRQLLGVLGAAVAFAAVVALLLGPGGLDPLPSVAAGIAAGALAGWLGWSSGRPIAERVEVLASRRSSRRLFAKHPAHHRWLWLDEAGLHLADDSGRGDWDWIVVDEVVDTGSHSFAVIRSSTRRYPTMALIIPHRLGPAAREFASQVRAGITATKALQPGPPPVTSEPAPGWGPLPGEVVFTLTPAEHVEVVRWNARRGRLAPVVAKLRRREMLPMLAVAPVLLVLWWPAVSGEYADGAVLIPAAVLTLGVIAELIWAWTSAPGREFRAQAALAGRLSTERAVDFRGPTRVWLDGHGLHVGHLHVHYFFAWRFLTDLEETPEFVFVCGDTYHDIVIPRRANPERVAWLAAGLRAGITRASG